MKCYELRKYKLGQKVKTTTCIPNNHAKCSKEIYYFLPHLPNDRRHRNTLSCLVCVVLCVVESTAVRRLRWSFTRLNVVLCVHTPISFYSGESTRKVVYSERRLFKTSASTQTKRTQIRKCARFCCVICFVRKTKHTAECRVSRKRNKASHRLSLICCFSLYQNELACASDNKKSAKKRLRKSSRSHSYRC